MPTILVVPKNIGLYNTYKTPSKLAWDTHFVGDVRAVNNWLLDMYQLKSLHTVLNPQVKKIARLPNVTLQTHHDYHYPNANPPGWLENKLQADLDVPPPAKGSGTYRVWSQKECERWERAHSADAIPAQCKRPS